MGNNALRNKGPYHPLSSLRKWHTKVGETSFIEASERQQNQISSLRARLILEETMEVIHELGYRVEKVDDKWALVDHGEETSYENLAKELADLKVVTYGTDDVYDIPAYDVFNEVMKSNFSKFGPDGRPLFRNDGKVLKGDNYQPPDIHGVMTGVYV